METNEAFTEGSEIQMIQYQYINKCHGGGGHSPMTRSLAEASTKELVSATP